MRAPTLSRRSSVTTVLAMTLMLTTSLATPLPIAGQTEIVVISQLYPGGGSQDAPLNADFVELFNRGGEPVNLDG
jgi:hypothetical protein